MGGGGGGGGGLVTRVIPSSPDSNDADTADASKVKPLKFQDGKNMTLDYKTEEPTHDEGWGVPVPLLKGHFLSPSRHDGHSYSYLWCFVHSTLLLQFRALRLVFLPTRYV